MSPAATATVRAAAGLVCGRAACVTGRSCAFRPSAARARQHLVTEPGAIALRLRHGQAAHDAVQKALREGGSRAIGVAQRLRALPVARDCWSQTDLPSIIGGGSGFSSVQFQPVFSIMKSSKSQEATA